MWNSLLRTALVTTLAAGMAVEAPTPATADTSKAEWEISCMIRKERFDFIQPGGQLFD